jgi:hypothetical protein
MAELVSASCIQCTPNPLCAFLKHACQSPERRARAAIEPASGACCIMCPTRMPVCTLPCELYTHTLVLTHAARNNHMAFFLRANCAYIIIQQTH